MDVGKHAEEGKRVSQNVVLGPLGQTGATCMLLIARGGECPNEAPKLANDENDGT